jgi:UDP-N-acetylmuramoyl-L-alanyl-D-glutamate--2,6-diaminopimelate ligase
MMLVKTLLDKIGIESNDDREVKGISFNSKNVENGYIFIAKKGFSYDGNNYINEAFSNGALCIISDSFNGNNIYYSSNIDEDKLTLINEFYNFDDIKIIGITGTNGKTSTCYLLYEALNNLGIKATYIGTLGIISENYFYELENTTPEVDILAREISKAKERNSKYIVMEVSSHSLSLNRVSLLKFDYIGFTNLSQDHLDFYKNMEEYFLSKKLLFDKASSDCLAVINKDDIYSKRIIEDYKGNVVSYGKNSDYEYEIISNDLSGISFRIDGEIIQSKLLFKTNIYNLAMVYLLLKGIGINKKDIVNVLSNCNVIKGRSEVLYNKEFCIILDYAHTPDAMERILLEVNKIRKNRVVCLFGCGGNRDNKKREIMGFIASINSDKVYICNDNPRYENEDKIINDITGLIKDKTNYEIIKNRKDAIEAALSNLCDGDILVILGKGHEEYQIIGNKKYHFSDKEIVLKWLEK